MNSWRQPRRSTQENVQNVFSPVFTLSFYLTTGNITQKQSNFVQCIYSYAILVSTVQNAMLFEGKIQMWCVTTTGSCLGLQLNWTCYGQLAGWWLILELSHYALVIHLKFTGFHWRLLVLEEIVFCKSSVNPQALRSE